MAQTTRITNLSTGEQWIFVNDLPLAENILNVAMMGYNLTGQLINEKVRARVAEKHPVKYSASTITGREFAFCESLDLHAVIASRLDSITL